MLHPRSIGEYGAHCVGGEKHVEHEFTRERSRAQAKNGEVARHQWVPDAGSRQGARARSSP
jgi:hypothetical protein